MDHALETIMQHAIENDALEEEGRFPDTEQDGDFRRSRRLAEQRFKLFDQCEENSVGSQDSTIVEYDDCNIKGIECEESSHNNNNNNDDNEDEGSDMEDFISDNDDVNSERSSMFSTHQQQLDIQRRKRKRILEDDSDDEEPPKKITKATVTAVVQQPPSPPPVIRVPQVPLLKSIISSQKRDRHTTIDRYCMPHVTTKQDTDWLQRVKDLSDYIVERRRNSRNLNPGYIRNINEDSSLERWAIGQRKKNLDRWKVCILHQIGFVFEL